MGLSGRGDIFKQMKTAAAFSLILVCLQTSEAGTARFETISAAHTASIAHSNVIQAYPGSILSEECSQGTGDYSNFLDLTQPRELQQFKANYGANADSAIAELSSLGIAALVTYGENRSNDTRSSAPADSSGRVYCSSNVV